MLEFADPQYRDIIMEKFLKGDEEPFEIMALKKDGTAFKVELSSRRLPHRGAHLNLTLFRKLSDAGDAKPARPYIESTKEHLGVFFDYSPDAYYIADATGKFIDVNKAAVELFGHVKEDIVGKTFLKLKLLSTDQIRKAATHLAFNIFGKPTEPEEYIIHRKDGSQVPVEINSTPVQINDKSLLFGIVRNISEKKKSEDALRRAISEIEILVEERRSRERKTARTRKNKKGI